MNLPDAPIPHDGFFVTHFLTVKDQIRSREFYAGVLGRKSHRSGEPLHHQAGQLLDRPQRGWWSHAR